VVVSTAAGAATGFVAGAIAGAASEGIKKLVASKTASAPTEVVGGGHGNATHSGAIDAKIDELVATGEYDTIYGNRSLNTAGQVGNQRPDITAVRADGTFDAFEYASPSQASGTSYDNLVNKIAKMKDANPNGIFQLFNWGSY
jgi:hypothetical protein